MDKVRYYRDNDGFYKQIMAKFLNRWFDKSILPDKRMTMLELIKHQILDPLVGKYHTLHWDGTNPFTNEFLTDNDLNEIIESNIEQSKPFVEYVRISPSNLVSNLNANFFSNNKNISTDSLTFRQRYHVGMECITPVFFDDFENSLCVTQIMDIPEHIDALKDFKPKRETELSRLRIDIKNDALSIVTGLNSVEEKAKAIYDWLCTNIAYDTTKQIHDAETCYKSKRGVCQAYSELFCYMAEAVGLTADMITGITKDAHGNIPDEKHSWIFVYTHGYDGILIDPTWGAGGVNGVTFIENNDKSTWFDVSPYWMIFSHFPDEQHWSKLDITVSEADFKRLPYETPRDSSDGKDHLFECISKSRQEV